MADASLPLALCNAHKSAVTAVAFSAKSGKHLASACQHSVVIWDSEQWRESAHLQHQQHHHHRSSSGAIGMQWDPIESAQGRVATLSRLDKTLRIWDVRTRREESMNAGADFCNALSWDPDGTKIAIQGERALGVIDLRKLGHFASTRKFETTRLNDLYYHKSSSTGGNSIALATGEGQVEFVHSSTLETMSRFVAHTRQCTLVRSAREARYLCTAGDDALVEVWDAGDLSCVLSLDTLMSKIRSLAMSETGHVAACADKTIEVMNVLAAAGSAAPRPITVTALEDITMLALSNADVPILAYCCVGKMDVYVQRVV